MSSIDWTAHRPVLEAARANGASTSDLLDIVVWREAEAGRTVSRRGAVRDGVRRLIGTKDTAGARSQFANGECATTARVCAPAAPPRPVPVDTVTERTAPRHVEPENPPGWYDTPRSILCISDTHYPIADYRAIDAVIAFARDVRPDVFVIAGDLIDGFLLGRYEKEPERLLDPSARLQAEIDAARPLVEEACRISRRVIWTTGNHCGGRMARQVMANPWLHGLRAMEWRRVTEYPEKVEIEPEGAYVAGIRFMHGDGLGSKMAGTGKHPANWMLENIGDANVVFGHTHVLESKFRTTWRNGQPKTRAAFNTGHLSDAAKQTYQRWPKWTTGFAYFECWQEAGHHRFSPYLIPIIDHRFTFGGRVYGGGSQ